MNFWNSESNMIASDRENAILAVEYFKKIFNWDVYAD